MASHVRRLRLLTCGALALLAGCAMVRQSRAPQADERAVLQVENRGFPDMTVHVVDGTRRIRVGTANGHTTTKLTIPASVVGGGRVLQFLCDPIGSQRTAVSQEIFVEPGDTVTLIIPPR